MQTKKTPLLIATTSSFLLAGFLFFTSMAGANPAAHVSGLNSLIGAKNTDSAGSYIHEADKQEGSKSTSATEASESKAYAHPKGHEKGYTASEHGYMHPKKEGSGGDKYSHGAPHAGSHGSSGHKGSHGKNPFKHILCFEEKLGLTAAQVEQIKSGEFEYEKFKVQSHASHAIAHMELDRLVHAETLDEAKIRSVGDQLIEIKSATIRAMIEAKILLLKILTPEQRSKVKEMHSRR
jgi:protein CpxP